MTAFLADSCAIIAFHGHGPLMLGMAGLEAMRDGEVHVSAIAVWEIERKSRLGRLPPPMPPGYRGTLAGFLREFGYLFASLTWDDAALAASLPDHHRDPMDRLMIATALRMDLTVITSDRVFQSYGVRTIW